MGMLIESELGQQATNGDEVAQTGRGCANDASSTVDRRGRDDTGRECALTAAAVSLVETGVESEVAISIVPGGLDDIVELMDGVACFDDGVR